MNQRLSAAFGSLWLARMTLFSLGFFLTAGSCFGQPSRDVFLKSITQQAHLTDGDLDLLDRGDPVVKVVRAKDRREIAVCGVVRLPASPAAGFQAFQRSMSQQKSDRVADGNRFGNPPRAEDLQALTLSPREIGDLQRCVVGDCKFKLSSRMIERFQSEVDWSSDDREARASELFREMLLDYVRTYSQQGNGALIEYLDGTHPVKLEEEYESLLQESTYLRTLAPELIDYSTNYPNQQMKGVKDRIVWAKISFGLKPVVIVTHQMVYEAASEDHILQIAKQIYASHYFDSSLGLTAIVGVKSGNGTDSFLIYVNHSRVDALQGAFSGLKRKLVEREAVNNLTQLLLATRANLHLNALPGSTAPPERPFRLAQWFRRPVFWLGLLSLSLGLLFWARYRISQSRNKASVLRAETNLHQ